jgi:hypothetical protein
MTKLIFENENHDHLHLNCQRQKLSRQRHAILLNKAERPAMKKASRHKAGWLPIVDRAIPLCVRNAGFPAPSGKASTGIDQVRECCHIKQRTTQPGLAGPCPLAANG